VPSFGKILFFPTFLPCEKPLLCRIYAG
jgi:hypothetical protein